MRGYVINHSAMQPPLLLFFPFHTPTVHPTNNLEKTTELGNEQSGQTATQRAFQ